MKRACVIGWPIEHSRSPLIHGYWLKTHGIDGSYTKVAVRPEDVKAFVRSLGEQGLSGCNVTVPHKEAVFAAADERDASAIAVGAANTLWLEDGKLFAANTDSYGFMRHLDLSAPGWNKIDAPAAILGAGGAARAIIYGLLEAGVSEVRVFNRTLERAEDLVRHFGGRVRAFAWDRIEQDTTSANVLINTTTLGMVKSPPLDIDLGKLRPEAVVADIVYVPLETPLLAAARRRGLRAVDGLGMLLHQAVPGFEKWFGVRPTVTPELRALIVRDIEAH